MSKTLVSILAGLGGMFGWGTSDFFANISSDKIGHSKSVFWSQLAGLILLGISFLFIRGTFLFPLSITHILLLGSICYTVGYLYFYKAFEVGNVSVVSATVNLNVVIAMLFAFIFKGQELVGLQPFAIVLILLGVTLVSLNIKDLIHSKVSLASGIKEVVIASVLFGGYWNLSEVLSEQMGWLQTSFWVKVFAIPLLLLIAYFSKEKIKLNKEQYNVFPLVALVGILEAGAVASVNYGLGIGDLVLVSPISSALSLVTIGLAVVFLKEKLTKMQSLGALITIVGIVLSAF